MARKISTPLIISLSAFLLSAGFACAQGENGGAGSPEQVFAAIAAELDKYVK